MMVCKGVSEKVTFCFKDLKMEAPLPPTNSYEFPLHKNIYICLIGLDRFCKRSTPLSLTSKRSECHIWWHNAKTITYIHNPTVFMTQIHISEVSNVKSLSASYCSKLFINPFYFFCFFFAQPKFDILIYYMDVVNEVNQITTHL